MNYIFDIVSTLFRSQPDNSWMEETADHYYKFIKENECLIIISSIDCEYDKKCRVVERIKDDQYIVLACSHGANIIVFNEYKCKGDYEKLYSVPGVREWRIRV